MESADRPNAPYDGSALIADPIHKYVTFTVPYAHPDPHEHTEKDLIDSPWVQRLRYIYQLQSARWVYPSAEHTRFVHSLGTMHVAGRFARHLYPFLKKVVKDVPSLNFVEEFLRVTALVHDIGHGPFCHFFDDNFLHTHGLTHERLGQIIIREHLAPSSRKSAEARPAIRERRRTESDQIAHLIPQGKGRQFPPPSMVEHAPARDLRGYTGDNLDYVLRDSVYVRRGGRPGRSDTVDSLHNRDGERVHYSQDRASVLQMFLNTRMYLYSNVYFHRTTRAIDIHLETSSARQCNCSLPSIRVRLWIGIAR